MTNTRNQIARVIGWLWLDCAFVVAVFNVSSLICSALVVSAVVGLVDSTVVWVEEAVETEDWATDDVDGDDSTTGVDDVVVDCVLLIVWVGWYVGVNVEVVTVVGAVGWIVDEIDSLEVDSVEAGDTSMLIVLLDSFELSAVIKLIL